MGPTLPNAQNNSVGLEGAGRQTAVGKEMDVLARFIEELTQEVAQLTQQLQHVMDMKDESNLKEPQTERGLSNIPFVSQLQQRSKEINILTIAIREIRSRLEI